MRFVRILLNGVFFVIVCHVCNDLSITMWQYWVTIGCLLGIVANAAIE